MTEAERRLAADRVTRNAARGVFDAELAQVKADLAARSIPGRVKDKADQEVREAIATGIDVASESKGIIAGVLAALALWFFRAPLIAFARDLMEPDDPAPVQEEPAKREAESN